jgi:hypothetical protein
MSAKCQKRTSRRIDAVLVSPTAKGGKGTRPLYQIKVIDRWTVPDNLWSRTWE